MTPHDWTGSLMKAATTLLVAALVAYFALSLLRQLMLPIVVLVALVAVYRIAVGKFRGGW